MSADGVRDFAKLRHAVDALHEAITSIDRGMVWSDTDEGGQFWGRQVGVLRNLMEKLEAKIDAECEEDEEEDEDEEEAEEGEAEDDWEREWREFERKGEGNG